MLVDRLFSTRFRLLTKNDYIFNKNESRRIYCREFLILIKKNNRKLPRLGLVVAKRHIRQANGRNSVKRIVRESFRHNKQILAGFDLLVIAQKHCDGLAKSELRVILDGLWKKILI